MPVEKPFVDPVGEGDLADVPTLFGRAQVYETTDGEGDLLRVLDVDGTWQSAAYVDERWSELAFRYHRLFAGVFWLGAPIERALMLGGGAFSFPTYVLMHRPGVQADVVEIDPAIIELARRWFFLDRLMPAQRARLNVVCGDAVAHLERCVATNRRYDLVVNDLFAAQEPTEYLMTGEGAQLLKQVLAPGGIYLANVVSALRGRRAKPLRSVRSALQGHFGTVVTIPLGAGEPRSPDNNVVIATDGDYPLEGVFGPF